MVAVRPETPALRVRVPSAVRVCVGMVSGIGSVQRVREWAHGRLCVGPGEVVVVMVHLVRVVVEVVMCVVEVRQWRRKGIVWLFAILLMAVLLMRIGRLSVRAALLYLCGCRVVLFGVALVRIDVAEPIIWQIVLALCF